MKLYIAHVGFYQEEFGIYELHSNFFTVATDIKSAKENIKNNPLFIKQKMHIDGIKEIINVDGYNLKLEKSDCKISNKEFNYKEVQDLS